MLLWLLMRCLRAQSQPTALADGNIRQAVTSWVDGPTTAALTYGSIGNWNTAEVTSMGALFKRKDKFSEDIASWNVVRVSNMAEMFNAASGFNQSIVGWNVQSVTSFNLAFEGTSALSNCLKASMYRRWGPTFQTAYYTWRQDYGCEVFNRCVACIDTNVGGRSIEAAVSSFASDPATASAKFGDIAGWNTASVVTLFDVFSGLRIGETFNAAIGEWNVASVSSLHSTFINAKAFNQDIGKWNVRPPTGACQRVARRRSVASIAGGERYPIVPDVQGCHLLQSGHRELECNARGRYATGIQRNLKLQQAPGGLERVIGR
jgi:hypothetical protein